MANCETFESRAEGTLPVYLVAGSKGGVGKSMVALVLVDQLLLKGQQVLYFETDTSNPDVWFCLERDAQQAPGQAIDGVVMHTINIDDEDSWIAMGNKICEHPDHAVVIGTASRTTVAVRKYGHVLRETMAAIERKVVTLWVIDEQRDSVAQLVEHIAVFPDNDTHVIKNSKHGPAAFGLYDQSALRDTIEAKGGLSLLLPRLALCVVNSLYSDRLAISQAVEVLPIANKVALNKFRKDCERVFEPLLGSAAQSSTRPRGWATASA